MHIVEYKGINSALVGLAQLLLDSGVERNTRGERCIELCEPIVIKIINPQSRLITIPERGWNIFLPYAESLWLASGRNDLEFIQYYLPKMSQFSDDNKYLRGGYGPRLRYYNGENNDYKKSERFLDVNNANEIDQFLYIEKSFKRDLYTRQGVIDIGDPMKDCFNSDGSIKTTKDLPCTRSLNFLRSYTNKLDLTVYMRSNDFIWGAMGVNMFNYMFIQEYFSAILGLEIGSYFHIVNNFHYYPDRHKTLIEKLAAVHYVTDESYNYTKKFSSLSEFDSLVRKLERWVSNLQTNNTIELLDLEDDFFSDWAKVLYLKTNNTRKMEFVNPLLNQYFLD